MCSIVGYIGNSLCKSFVLQGLAKLEYRGYDSAGFACLVDSTKEIVCLKAAGALSELQVLAQNSLDDGYIGIGHTRWSTHGEATQDNAHPHTDCLSSVAIVHNGVIENHLEIRNKLSKNHLFKSHTDTEIVAHYLEELFSQGLSVHEAMQTLLSTLSGSFALVIMLVKYPNMLIAVRKKSPLCIGIGDQEMMIASDPIAFAEKTSRVLFLPDDHYALVVNDSVLIKDISGNDISISEQKIIIDVTAHDRSHYEHYMLKEIFEQPATILKTIQQYRVDDNAIYAMLGLETSDLQKIEKLQLIGCGTSWHAARIAQFFFETVAAIPTSVHLASEYRYMPVFQEKNTAVIALSQSGETADTLEVVRMLNGKKHIIALTNNATSSLARESDGILLTHAGREIAVAATKSFTAQLALLYWFSHWTAVQKGIASKEKLEIVYQEIMQAVIILEQLIHTYSDYILTTIADLFTFDKAIFLGRHINYPFAMEAALKLKEIAYIFSQCYPAGELKHGPLALIDKDIPIIIFSHPDHLIYHKLLSNVQEVKARKGFVIAFGFEGQKELKLIADIYFEIPVVNSLLSPLVMSGLMQYFVYQVAKARNCPIDKPRNLAKSVTVE